MCGKFNILNLSIGKKWFFGQRGKSGKFNLLNLSVLNLSIGKKWFFGQLFGDRKDTKYPVDR